MTDNVIFYQEVGSPIPNRSAITVPFGFGTYFVEYTDAFSQVLNAPAVGDSWAFTTNGSTGVSGNAAIIATMASAPNMFISGISAPTIFPFCVSLQGLWYNAMINPPGPSNTNTTSVNTPAGPFTQQINPLAPYFTMDVMNFNIDPTSTDIPKNGGLWSGIFNANDSNLAVNSLSMPMYPVNLSAYVAADEVNGDFDQYASPIYGGHMTLAIGDPFLVSSYAAKILWFLVTNTGYAFGPDSLTSDDITHIQSLVVPPTGDGVFESVSISSYYASWLFEAPHHVVSTLSTMNQAASTPITHTSIWGKIFGGLVTVATKATEVAIGTLAGPEASVAVKGAVKATTKAAGDALDNYASSQITAAFTDTESLPAPVAQNAPPVINPTYSSTDLLGMMLTNVFVQAELNNGLENPNPLPLPSGPTTQSAPTACARTSTSSTTCSQAPLTAATNPAPRRSTTTC